MAREVVPTTNVMAVEVKDHVLSDEQHLVGGSATFFQSGLSQPPCFGCLPNGYMKRVTAIGLEVAKSRLDGAAELTLVFAVSPLLRFEIAAGQKIVLHAMKTCSSINLSPVNNYVEILPMEQFAVRVKAPSTALLRVSLYGPLYRPATEEEAKVGAPR